jgi:DNA-directed RNA polymerase subunit RPC12/RpoP
VGEAIESGALADYFVPAALNNTVANLAGQTIGSLEKNGDLSSVDPNMAVLGGLVTAGSATLAGTAGGGFLADLTAEAFGATAGGAAHLGLSRRLSGSSTLGVNLVRIYVVGAVAVAAAVFAIRTISKRVAGKSALPEPRVIEPSIVMPRLGQFRIERRVRPAIRMLSVAFILTILLARATSPQSRLLIVAVIAEVICILGLSVLGLIIDATMRCTGCVSRMLLESREFPPYPPPRKQTDALRTGEFQCMYCGQRYIIPGR